MRGFLRALIAATRRLRDGVARRPTAPGAPVLADRPAAGIAKAGSLGDGHDHGLRLPRRPRRVATRSIARATAAGLSPAMSVALRSSALGGAVADAEHLRLARLLGAGRVASPPARPRWPAAACRPASRGRATRSGGAISWAAETAACEVGGVDDRDRRPGASRRPRRGRRPGRRRRRRRPGRRPPTRVVFLVAKPGKPRSARGLLGLGAGGRATGARRSRRVRRPWSWSCRRRRSPPDSGHDEASKSSRLIAARL